MSVLTGVCCCPTGRGGDQLLLVSGQLPRVLFLGEPAATALPHGSSQEPHHPSLLDSQGPASGTGQWILICVGLLSF